MADFGIHNLALFVLAGWALNLTPGPDVFYMVTHSLKSGWRAGTVAVAGICAGCLVHVTAAAVGLSALVAASATTFTVLKWVGAVYLVYVGFKMLTSKAKPYAIQTVAVRAHPTLENSGFLYRKVFLQGFWTNALNPKVALFFLAFLPQFISPTATHPPLAFLFLGVLFIVNSVPINMAYVLLAAWLGQRASVQRGLNNFTLWLERVAGAVFIAFGVKLALSETAR